MPTSSLNSPAAPLQTEGLRYVMGTLLKVCVRSEDPGTQELVKETIFTGIQRLEDLWSVYRPASEISRINALAGQEPLQVSSETIQVLERSLYFANLTGGACDPTIGPLLRLWKLNGQPGHLPEAHEVARARALVDYHQVRINRGERTVFLPVKGMHLDLGWIGKGVAMDFVLNQTIATAEVTHVALDFGGHLLFWDRDAAPPRRIFIDTGFLPGQRIPSFEFTGNGSVSTTSNAERYSILRDKRTGMFRQAGHVLDPHTGNPAQGVESVTVTAPTAAEADAFSTALFVMGFPDGFEVLREVPRVQAYFLQRAGRDVVARLTPSWPGGEGV